MGDGSRQVAAAKVATPADSLTFGSLTSFAGSFTGQVYFTWYPRTGSGAVFDHFGSGNKSSKSRTSSYM